MLVIGFGFQLGQDSRENELDPAMAGSDGSGVDSSGGAGGGKGLILGADTPVILSSSQMPLVLSDATGTGIGQTFGGGFLLENSVRGLDMALWIWVAALVFGYVCRIGAWR